jgi:hypothetical protein
MALPVICNPGISRILSIGIMLKIVWSSSPILWVRKQNTRDLHKDVGLVWGQSHTWLVVHALFMQVPMRTTFCTLVIDLSWKISNAWTKS